VAPAPAPPAKPTGRRSGRRSAAPPRDRATARPRDPARADSARRAPRPRARLPAMSLYDLQQRTEAILKK
jgi:hypothetical protein